MNSPILYWNSPFSFRSWVKKFPRCFTLAVHFRLLPQRSKGGRHAVSIWLFVEQIPVHCNLFGLKLTSNSCAKDLQTLSIDCIAYIQGLKLNHHSVKEHQQDSLLHDTHHPMISVVLWVHPYKDRKEWWLCRTKGLLNYDKRYLLWSNAIWQVCTFIGCKWMGQGMSSNQLWDKFFVLIAILKTSSGVPCFLE